MKEQWKDIKEFEGLYEISNLGKVRKVSNGAMMKTRANTKGYIQVPITKNGKQYFKCVHKLVAEAFIDNPLNRTEVNHIDENKQNNTVSNLEWCTHSENLRHGTATERAMKTRQKNHPPKRVIAVFPDASTRCFDSARVASKELGISENGIRTVLSGNRASYLGIVWIYLKN